MELLPILYKDGVSSFYHFYIKISKFKVSKIRIEYPDEGWPDVWLKPCGLIT